MKSDGSPHIAIVGAGFSGTMLAVHLSGLGARVTLIDRSGRFGEGLAYSTKEPVHLLNVRAGNMSAYADAPDHFARWLEGRGEGNGATFAARRSYRAYLAETLKEVGTKVRCVDDHAISLEGTTLNLECGAKIVADSVVVAAGNLPPAPFGVLEAAGFPYINDPWTAEGRAGLVALAAKGGDVLVLGTGLTMVDTVLALEAHGLTGGVVAISRRGRLPETHAAFEAGDIAPPTATSPTDLLAWARRQSVTHDWRAVVDSLRPRTAAFWRSWSVEQRGSFLRHLRPWWDVRRHRIAPQIGKQLEVMISAGRLKVSAGKIAGAHHGRVVVRYRGEAEGAPLDVAGVVNCTGPRGDIRRSGDPLIVALLEGGAARTDLMGLGLDVDDDCRAIGWDGDVTPGLYAIGPMTRGAFWEIVAVPDIRAQAQTLAGTIVADAAGTSRTEPWQVTAAAR